MSDLTATNCGCGCGTGRSGSGDNCSCNILIWILILSCLCGNSDDGCGLFGGSSLFGGRNCGCDDDCNNGCSWIWIIILILFIR